MENSENNHQQNYQKPTPASPKKRGWLVALIILAILVVGASILAVALIRTSKKSSINCQELTKKLVPAEVTVTKNGFEPSDVKIKKCQQVSWTNQDIKPHQVAADPYPTNSSYPEFVGPALVQNDSFTFTFEKAGTFTYHDQLNPFAFKGTVTVE